MSGTLTNTGTILDTNTANITAGNAGNIVTTINNEAGATFNFQADGSLDSFNGETNTSFNNAGTLEKSAGTGISTFLLPVNNTAGHHRGRLRHPPVQRRRQRQWHRHHQRGGRRNCRLVRQLLGNVRGSARAPSIYRPVSCSAPPSLEPA